MLRETDVPRLAWLLVFTLLLPARTRDARERLDRLMTDSLADVALGNYSEAVDTLEILEGASDDPAFERRVERLLDRARRALRFEDRLPALLGEKALYARAEVHLLSGDFGSFAGSDGLALQVRFVGDDGHERVDPVPARKLAPATILALSGPL